MAVNAGRHGHPFFKSLGEFALRLIAHIQRNGCDRLIRMPQKISGNCDFLSLNIITQRDLLRFGKQLGG